MYEIVRSEHVYSTAWEQAQGEQDPGFSCHPKAIGGVSMQVRLCLRMHVKRAERRGWAQTGNTKRKHETEFRV